MSTKKATPNQQKYGLPYHPRKKKVNHTPGFFKKQEKKADAKYKWSFDGLLDSARTHIGKALDKKGWDYYLAWAGTTFLVHQTIVASEDFMNTVLSFDVTAAKTAYGIAYGSISGLINALPFNIANPLPPLPDINAPQVQVNDWLVWAISIVIAWFFVNYFGQICIAVGDAFKGIGQLVGFMLPMAGAAAV